MEGAQDVGVDEVAGGFNRAVHVRFGCEVEDVGDGLVADDADDGRLVVQVHLLESVFGMAGDGADIFQTPGIGEAVEVDHACDFRLNDDVFKQVGADEVATAGDEQVHRWSSLKQGASGQPQGRQ